MSPAGWRHTLVRRRMKVSESSWRNEREGRGILWLEGVEVMKVDEVKY